MNPHDEYATDTTRAAIKAALAGLDCAYKASVDPRIEDTISGLICALEEGLADLNIHVDAMEAARRPWFTPYRAA
jgi:hypothetical protein